MNYLNKIIKNNISLTPMQCDGVATLNYEIEIHKVMQYPD